MRHKITALIMGLFLFLSAGKVFCAGSSAFRVELPDSEAMGKGFAFVGEADNPSAVFYNPAGLTQLKGGQHISLGATELAPLTNYDNLAGAESQMRRSVYTIPHFYYVSDFGLKRIVFGIGVDSPWGLSTQWAKDSFARYSATKTDIASKVFMFTGAYQVTEKLSFGAGLDYVTATMGKQKELAQPGAADGDFELRIKDSWAYGYRLALLYKLNDRHSFGIQYRSPVKLKLRGEVDLSNLNNASPYFYKTVFGGPSYSEKTYMQAELPEGIIAGYSFKPSDKWIVNFDVEWMNWASIKQEYLIYQDETNATRLAVLNNGNPASRDWIDAVTLALGGQYNVNDKLRLRSGVYFKQKSVPEPNFEPSLPDSKAWLFSTGFGYSLCKNVTLDMAYAFQKSAARKINNSAASGTINGTYRNYANMYATTLRLDF